MPANRLTKVLLRQLAALVVIVLGVNFIVRGAIGPLLGAVSLNWRLSLAGILLSILGAEVYRQAAK